MTDQWYLKAANDLDSDSYESAKNRQKTLTKPFGSLGQ